MMHPIENIMKGAMEEIKAIVDVNTIVGDPILTGEETMISPVSKVSLGFISGGGEYEMGSDKPVRKSGTALDADLGTDHEGGRYPFAGAAVAGMSLTPMAFLSVNAGCVKVLQVQYKNSWDRVIDLLPEAICAVERMVCDTASPKCTLKTQQKSQQ